MATTQRGCSAKKPRTFSRESFLRNPTPPSARAPCAWKDRFARSRPIMLTFSMDALSVRGMRKHHHLGTSRCRQEGHPLHHWLPFLVWCISGSRLCCLFLVEGGAAMIVASTLSGPAPYHCRTK